MQVAQVSLENVSPHQFWSIADNFPDLVSRLHVQMRVMVNCYLNGGFPWLSNTDGAHCFSARRVSKRSFISSLIVQNSKIILNPCGLI